MLQQWRTLTAWLSPLALLSSLGLHVYLGTYSRFIADDYCSAGMAERFGVLRAVWYWYLNWTGRYAASTLDAIFGLLGPRVTPYVSVIVVIAWVAVLAWTVSLLRSDSLRPTAADSVGLALAVLFLTLILSPSVPQSLYWGQGMRSIVPPLILGTLYVALFLLVVRSRPTVTVFWLSRGASFVLAFVMGGLNETFTSLELALFVLALILVASAWRSSTPRQARAFVLAGFLGTALAFLIVVIAPGNALRQAFYPPPPGLAGILRIASAGFLQFLGHSFGRADRLAGVVGVAALAAVFGLRASSPRPKAWLIPLVLVAALAFAFCCFLPAAYGLSDVPPDRTLMIPAYLIALALTFSGFVAGSLLGWQPAGGSWRAWCEVALAVSALSACLTSAWLADRLLLDSRQTYRDYAIRWDSNNASILAARAQGQTQVVIQTLPNWADLDEPNDNPKFWVNVCYREYYGIEVLAASRP